MTASKKYSLKSLLNDLRKKRGLTDEQIGIDAGVEDVQKGQAVYSARVRNKNIAYCLADWVVNNTFGGDNPIQRAFNALETANMTPAQMLLLRGLIEQFNAVNNRISELTERQAHADGPPPMTRDEARRALRVIDQQMKLLPAESADWETLDRVSRHLAPICAVPDSQSNPAPTSPDSASAKTNGAANVAAHSGTMSNPHRS